MAATTSMAAAAAGATVSSMPRVVRCSASPYLPPRASSRTSPGQLSVLGQSRRFPLLQVRASDDSPAAIDTNEIFTDLKEKWDGVENKSAVILYGGGAIVAVWLSTVVVGAINSVPLLPKIMELVGLGYTGCLSIDTFSLSQAEKNWPRILTR